MQNLLADSAYLKWYVMTDPGTVAVANRFTDSALMFFRPSMGLEKGNALCIAAGTDAELHAFKLELDDKREQLKGGKAQVSYIAIENALARLANGEAKAEILTELDSLKSHQSDVQKERITRLRKR